ncbi:MAG: glycosyltransferase family 2 protein [Rhodothermales bacterium]
MHLTLGRPFTTVEFNRLLDVAMVYTITPVHNRRPITRTFLECMRKQTFEGIRVVIVDDGSTDGTSDMIRKEYPEVTLLTGDGSLWWSGGTNLGLNHLLTEAEDDDYVLIINDDLEIEPSYVQRLTDFARRHPDALIGSVVVDIEKPDTVWDGGRLTNWITAKHRVMNQGRSLSSFPDSAYFEVSQLTGRGTLIPVSVFRKVGLYDDVHFRHRGDTEFPVRASRQGYRLLVYYGARVMSHVNLTHGSEQEAHYRLRDFRHYFFDFRSSGWIKFRFYFALKTAISPLQFVSFFVCDLLRVSVHFLRRCHVRGT